uniref:Sperm acrosome associated 4 like n=1 Tax=Amphilophus citrinellus TaxID=61819 RepID=A0A3Q0SMA8_AMPCI
LNSFVLGKFWHLTQSSQALVCYKCDIGIGSLCITTKQTCSSGQLCFSGVGKAAGFLDIKTKGCLDTANCNKTESTTVGSNNTIYSLTKTCCNTDLCNAAPGMPGTSSLTLALTAISALFVGNILG